MFIEDYMSIELLETGQTWDPILRKNIIVSKGTKFKLGTFPNGLIFFTLNNGSQKILSQMSFKYKYV